MKRPQFVFAMCTLVWAAGTTMATSANIDKWTQQTLGTIARPEQVVNKPTSTYISNPKDPRASGRKFSVQYPSSWDFEPMDDTNLLMGIKDEEYGEETGFLRGCFIYVKEIEMDDFPTATYPLAFRTPDIVERFVGKDEKIVLSEYDTVDNLPALRMLTEGTLDDDGDILYNKTLTLKIGYKNTMINLVCGTSGENAMQANKHFEESSHIFASFFQSFSLLETHDNWDKADEELFAHVEKVLSFVEQTKLPTKQKLEHTSAMNANLAEVGGLCLDSEAKVQKVKQNPQVISYTGVWGMYYTWTDGVAEYCKEYGTPTRFINLFKAKFSPIQKDVLNKIKNIMGDEYTQCLQKDTSILQPLAQYSIGRFRGRTNLSREVFCKGLMYEEPAMRMIVDSMTSAAKDML